MKAPRPVLTNRVSDEFKGNGTNDSTNQSYVSTSIQKEKDIRSSGDTDISDLTNDRDNSKQTFMAVYVGILSAMGGFLYGYDTGFINNLVSMPYVQQKFAFNKSSFSTSEMALLTGILSIGTFFGSLFAPIVSDRLGRRFSIVWSALTLFNLGTVLQIAAVNLNYLYAGRFFNGFGLGIMSAIIPLYQAEVSPRWIRGSIISFYQWSITWGLLVSSGISQGTQQIDDSRCYRVPIGLQFLWANLVALGIWLLPESPRFYIMHKNYNAAIDSLARFRRVEKTNKELIDQLVDIKAAYDYEMSFGKLPLFACFKNSPGFEHQRKRMITGILLNALQQCSGINFIFYYGVNFFAHTGVENSYLMSFVTYAVNVIFTLPGILLVDKWGRRKLLLYGSIGMCVSNFIIAIVGLKVESVVSDKVMIAFVCVFIAFFAATWGPLPWVVAGELYSLSVRQRAVSITASSNWLVNFIFAYSTPYIINPNSHTSALGTTIFFLWGSFNFAGILLAYFLVYETKGLTLEDVDELYRNCTTAWKSVEINEKLKLNIISSNFKEALEKDSDISIIENADGADNDTNGDYDNHMNVQNSFDENSQMSVAEPATYSPADYLNMFAAKMEQSRDNIMSDRILNRQTQGPPSVNFSDEGDEVNTDVSTYDFGLYGAIPASENLVAGSMQPMGPLESENHEHSNEDLNAMIEDMSEYLGIDLTSTDNN
ncbi:glucose sensor [Martiniozyma asiatica (nom. inval.)]|nr:glucose sensor [Martiniozyma asiatica]